MLNQPKEVCPGLYVCKGNNAVFILNVGITQLQLKPK